MKVRVLLLCAAMLVMAAVNGCKVTPVDSAAEAAKLKALDDEWSKVVATKDLDKVLSYYADDAVFLAPGEAAVTDKAAMRKSWEGTLSAFESLSWVATYAQVSGEMGYVGGSWKGSLKGADGKVTPASGKTLSVWKKQADGAWKAIADTYNVDTVAP